MNSNRLSVWTLLCNSFFIAMGISLAVTIADVVLLLSSGFSFWGMSEISLFSKISIQATSLLTNFIIINVIVLLSIWRNRLIEFMAKAAIYIYILVFTLSWVLFYKLNVFLNVETMTFFIVNFTQILMHIWQSSSVAIAMLLFMTFGSIWAAFLIKEQIDRLLREIRVKRAVSVALILFVLLLSGISWNVFSSYKVGKKLIRIEASPAIALLKDSSDSLRKINTDTGHSLIISKKSQVSSTGYFQSAGVVRNKTPVIIIVIESFRADLIDDASVMPNLWALKEDSLFFRNAFAPINLTDGAWPAIFSSAYPLRAHNRYYYPNNILFPRVFIYDVLKKNGYTTGIFSAQNEDWSKMRNYLDNGSLDVYFDSSIEQDGHYVSFEDRPFVSWIYRKGTAGKIDDNVVVKKTIDWLKDMQRNDFFVGMFFQRTHFPYTWPEDFIPKFSPHEIKPGIFFSYYPKSETLPIRNRYYNSLSYTDQQIGKLISFLKEKNLYDKSLIVITGDHGESFNEKGYSGHGNYLFNEEVLTNVVVKLPNQRLKGKRDEFIETIDIPPLICDVLGVRPHPAFQGVSPFQKEKRNRKPIFITVKTVRTFQDAIVYRGWKMIKEYKHNEEFLYDLRNDFMETKNLAREKQQLLNAMRGIMIDWRKNQLKYYADKFRQKTEYPPEVKRPAKHIEEMSFD